MINEPGGALFSRDVASVAGEPPDVVEPVPPQLSSRNHPPGKYVLGAWVHHWSPGRNPRYLHPVQKPPLGCT